MTREMFEALGKSGVVETLDYLAAKGGEHRFTDLLWALHIPNSSLANILERLREVRLVIQEKPEGAYRVTDAGVKAAKLCRQLIDLPGPIPMART